MTEEDNVGKYSVIGQVLTMLLLLASSVRLEKLAAGGYRVEAIFAATTCSPPRAITASFTSHQQAEAAYWRYLLEKTPLSTVRPTVNQPVPQPAAYDCAAVGGSS